MKKITFITLHTWKTKRLGGFHKFAEAACENNIETIFFSFPRPYYAYFMHDELYNKQSINQLKKGICYEVGKTKLHNITFPTCRLPDIANKIIPDCLMNFFVRFSFSSFKHFSKKWLDGTDVFVFESNESIVLFDKLKKQYPNAKFVYRPSDPLMFEGALQRYVKNEINILKKADISLFVNTGTIDIYKKHITDFDKSVNYQVLTNGVDIEPFEQNYPIPLELQKENTILYIGAWKPDWNLIFLSAEKNKDLNFIIVCPNKPDETILKTISKIDNITYIPGIMPQEIPKWLTNCSVVMVPYNKQDGNRISGITAKYFQAMAAHKPIVAYYDTPLLKEIGIPVTHSYDEFINEIRKALSQKKKIYDYDLKSKKWSVLKEKFIEIISTIE